jgi:hypothetical protein
MLIYFVDNGIWILASAKHLSLWQKLLFSASQVHGCQTWFGVGHGLEQVIRSPVISWVTESIILFKMNFF